LSILSGDEDGGDEPLEATAKRDSLPSMAVTTLTAILEPVETPKRPRG